MGTGISPQSMVPITVPPPSKKIANVIQTVKTNLINIDENCLLITKLSYF